MCSFLKSKYNSFRTDLVMSRIKVPNKSPLKTEIANFQNLIERFVEQRGSELLSTIYESKSCFDICDSSLLKKIRDTNFISILMNYIKNGADSILNSNYDIEILKCSHNSLSIISEFIYSDSLFIQSILENGISDVVVNYTLIEEKSIKFNDECKKFIRKTLSEAIKVIGQLFLINNEVSSQIYSAFSAIRNPFKYLTDVILQILEIGFERNIDYNKELCLSACITLVRSTMFDNRQIDEYPNLPLTLIREQYHELIRIGLLLLRCYIEAVGENIQSLGLNPQRRSKTVYFLINLFKSEYESIRFQTFNLFVLLLNIPYFCNIVKQNDLLNDIYNNTKTHNSTKTYFIQFISILLSKEGFYEYFLSLQVPDQIYSYFNYIIFLINNGSFDLSLSSSCAVISFAASIEYNNSTSLLNEELFMGIINNISSLLEDHDEILFVNEDTKTVLLRGLLCLLKTEESSSQSTFKDIVKKSDFIRLLELHNEYNLKEEQIELCQNLHSFFLFK